MSGAINFVCRDDITRMLNSYNMYKGTVIMNIEKTSGGVMIADNAIINTKTCFRYFFNIEYSNIPCRANIKTTMGIKKVIPHKNKVVSNDEK